MGIYYQVACDEARERIDPACINGLGNKFVAIAHPEHPFGQVIIFAMLRRWAGKSVRLAEDYTDDAGYYEYRDITEDVIREYNHAYGTSLTFVRDFGLDE